MRGETARRGKIRQGARVTNDELISTTIKPHGTVEERRVTEDALKVEAMQEACGIFLTAERKFRKLNANPDCVTDVQRTRTERYLPAKDGSWTRCHN